MDALDKLTEQTRTALREALGEQLDKVLDAHPILESVGWEQWTPHYNDGDPCIFKIHSDVPYLNGEKVDAYDLKLRGGPGKALTAPMEAIRSILEASNPANFLLAFGDHQHVTYSKEGGFNIVPVDHD